MNRYFWLSILVLASIGVAFGQDGPRVGVSPLRRSLNLSDLPGAESARDNLGLPDNIEEATSVASLGVNVFVGKQTMTQSVSKGSTLWHGHFENTGTGAGSYLGVYLGSPNRYGYIRGFDYDYGTFGLADSLEFGGQNYGAIRLHQTLATGVVGIMFGGSAPYTAVATWVADGTMENAGDIIANSVNVVDGIASSAAMDDIQNALASTAYGFSSDTRNISAAMDNSQNALASSAADFSSGTRAILTTLTSAVATGTSGTKVPLLDGANTWSANQGIKETSSLVCWEIASSTSIAGRVREYYISGSIDITASGVATDVFSITTTDEGGSYDEGAYTVEVKGIIGINTTSRQSVTAAQRVEYTFTHAQDYDGNPSDTGLIERYLGTPISDSAANCSIVSTVGAVVNTSNYIRTVTVTINTQGATQDHYGIAWHVTVISQGFYSTPPALAVAPGLH